MSWDIQLDDPTGERISFVEKVINFTAPKIARQPAPCVLTLPESFDMSLLRVDGWIEFRRTPIGGSKKFHNVYQIRAIGRQDDANGRENIVVVGYDPLYILTSRIIAYAAGSAQADMTDQADDMLKAIVIDNLGADATGARNISSNGISVASDLALGPSITKQFAYRPLLQ